MAEKVCAIVGVGPGLSMSVAQRFAREGYHLALIARTPSKLADFVDDVISSGGEASSFTADAGDFDAVMKAFEGIRTEMHAPEVLIYNAAVVTEGSPSMLDAESLVNHFRVNVAGALVAAQQVIPAMRERGEGTILFTGGGLALNPRPNLASLAIGKAGIRSLAYSLGAELAPDGIQVATVTVRGFINREDESGVHPDNIAEHYWKLHTTARDQREIQFP